MILSSSKFYLHFLLVTCVFATQADVSVRNCQGAIKSMLKEHPVITTTVATAAFISAWYAWVQMQSKYAQIEVELKEFTPAGSATQSHGINYLYAHGIAESYKQAFWYSKTTPHGTVHNPYLYDGRVFSFDFPDATERFWRMNFTQTSLAQANEIEALRSTYDQACARLTTEGLEDQDFVMIGMSRGATTILNFMSTYKPEKIKAIVVESPFDSTHAVAKNMLSKVWLENVYGMQSIAHALVGVAFWQHSTLGIHAKDVVKDISKDVPILLIASNQDVIVPAQSTIALYNMIKQSGHQKVHLYRADLGPHGRFLKHENGRRYQNVVQAFYRNYGLPHDSRLADLGQADFEACQPDTD